MSSLIKELFQDNIKKEDEELFERVLNFKQPHYQNSWYDFELFPLQVGEFRIQPSKIKISNICTSLVHAFNFVAKSKSLELTFRITAVILQYLQMIFYNYGNF